MNKRVTHIEIENREMRNILENNKEGIKAMVTNMQNNLDTMNKNIANLEKRINK